MGPIGQGPMTGRGMGWCGAANTPVDMPPRGRGFGAGRGGGQRGRWGHRHWYHATGLTGWQRAQMGWPGPGASFTPIDSEEPEIAAIKQQAANLEQALAGLRARIREVEKPAADTTSSTEKEPR
jgi:hypothetical protein